MRFPGKKGSDERLKFYQDIIDKCMASRGDRREKYDLYRKYFLHGGMEDDCGGFNKIYPHIDQLASLMYSQETTKFGTTIGATVSDLELQKVDTLNQAVNDEWHSSNGDIVFGIGLRWALVFSTMVVKCRWALEQIEPFLIEPHNFGVYREDVQGLHRQEAMTEVYYIPKSQLERELMQAPHPRAKKILDTVSWMPIAPKDQSSTMSEVVITAVQPQITGDIDYRLNATVDYTPIVKEDMACVYELRMWDDEEHDYRVVTIADPQVEIYDRLHGESGLFMKGELPYVQICPNPVHDYFWGIAEVERLKGIQELRNKRMRQINHILEKQARPPFAASGFDADIMEIQTAMDSPNGGVNSPTPGAKLETYVPEHTEDLFREIREYDLAFEDMSGITNVMSGKGEQGVRSKAHASTLARLGSSRAKARALLVEDSLEKLATLYLQILRHYDKDRRYKSEDGTEFIANQFTDDFIVKVDAHSSSPIFSEDLRETALQLFKAKAIDRESLIDFMDVPNKQLLKQKLKTKIEPAEAAAAKQQLAAEAAGHKPKRSNGNARANA